MASTRSTALLAQVWPCAAERCKKFQDDGIGGEEDIITPKRMIEGGHGRMPTVPPQEQGHPIERIGKETAHGYRFGRP